jgi:hypothetical protein
VSFSVWSAGMTPSAAGSVWSALIRVRFRLRLTSLFYLPKRWPITQLTNAPIHLLRTGYADFLPGSDVPFCLEARVENRRSPFLFGLSRNEVRLPLPARLIIN